MPDYWEQVGKKPTSSQLSVSAARQGATIRPLSNFESFWNRYIAPPMQKGETTLSRVFNWADLTPTMENAALMGKNPYIAGQQAATQPITLADVAQHYATPKKIQYGGTEHSQTIAKPFKANLADWALAHPAILGAAGAAQEFTNPATYMGPPIHKLLEYIKAPLAGVAERTGIASLFDPLHGTSEQERSAARWLAQEYKHGDVDAQNTAVRMFKDMSPEDQEMVPHLVEAMKPKPNPDDEFLLANAKIERPNLVAKAQELHDLSM